MGDERVRWSVVVAALALLVACGSGSKETASPTPSNAGIKVASADGRFEFAYPKSWRIADHTSGEGSELWTLTNFEPTEGGEGLANGMFKADVSIESAGDKTLATLREELCATSTESPVEVLQCNARQINGREWMYAYTRSDLESPVKVVTAATVAGGKVYRISGIVGEGSRDSLGLVEVSQIIDSLVVR